MAQTVIKIDTDGDDDLRDNPVLDELFADAFASAAKRVSDRLTDAAFDPTPIGGSGRYQKAPVAPILDYKPDAPQPRYNTDQGLQRDLEIQRRQQEKDAKAESRAQAKEARDTARAQAKAQREAKKLAAEQAKEAKAQAAAQAKAEADRKEAISAESRAKGNAVYGYGNLAKSVTGGGLSTGSGVAQGVAQLGSTGVLGPVAAGFGPMALGIGAAVDAGTQLISGAFRSMKAAAEMGEKAVKQIAGNDGLGLLQTGAEGAAKSLESVPVVGKMFADGVRAAIAPIGLFRATVEAFTGRANDLAKYNPQIALAQMQANINQMYADRREAKQQGAALANLIIREQQMNQAFQKAFAPIKTIFINTAADIAELVKMFIDILGIGRNIESGTISLVSAIPLIGEALALALKEYRQMNKYLKKTEDSMWSSEPMRDLDDMMAKLNLTPAPGADAKKAVFDRANATPFFMNPPRN